MARSKKRVPVNRDIPDGRCPSGKRKHVQSGQCNSEQSKKHRNNKGKSSKHKPGVSPCVGQTRQKDNMRRSRGKKKRKNESNVCASSSSSSLLSSQESSVQDIPGFYYDPEKKKYFKILKSTNSVNVITKETIAKDAAEKTRLKDLSSPTPSTQNPTKNNLRLLRVLWKRERGQIDGTWLSNHMLVSGVRALNPAGSWKVFDDPRGDQERLDHMQVMDSTVEKDKLLVLWSLKGTVMQRMQLLPLSERPRMDDDSARLSVDVHASSTTTLQSWISNLCWAPLRNVTRQGSNNNVLYTTMCHTGYTFSLAYIRNLDKTRSSDECVDFNLGSRATWSCAWNHTKQQFSIGSEKRALLIDVETRRMWELPCSSDPFVQVFSQNSGNFLYSGGRNGVVMCHDLRTRGSRHVTYTGHSNSIASLKIVNNGTYLVSSDISGKMLMWDTRMRRQCFEYSGLVNRYSRIPLHIDEMEQIVYGAGQDCYTRFWSVKTGELLKSLPPPIPANTETIPAVQYATRWGNRHGNAGLIMGLGNRLYYYSGLV